MSNQNQSTVFTPSSSTLWGRLGGGSFLPDVLAILFFVAVSVVYFIVPIRDGLVLTGHDHTGGVGSGVEMEQYRATHNGERTRWTNTLFCGMPTYQMSPSYRSTETLSTLERVYQLGCPASRHTPPTSS